MERGECATMKLEDARFDQEISHCFVVNPRVSKDASQVLLQAHAQQRSYCRPSQLEATMNNAFSRILTFCATMFSLEDGFEFDMFERNLLGAISARPNRSQYLHRSTSSFSKYPVRPLYDIYPYAGRQ